MSWKIHVYGTRGAFPHPEKDYMKYGGNTSCFYLECGNHILLDAGSGLSRIEEIYRDKRPVHILLSHVHMDHIMGLYQSRIFFEKDREIHIYGESRNNLGIEEQLRTVITKPYWPIGFDEFEAKTIFHTIMEGECFQIDGIHILTKRSFHPDETMLIRLEDENCRIGYTLDYEAAMDKNHLAEGFLQDCDVIIFDGNFIPDQEIPGWGHSTWRDGIRFRKNTNTKKMLISHYAYAYTDQILEEQERLAKKEDEYCIFAREGMVIEC